ncbi:MAG: FAD:protein FMN transferase [Acutalibacteraceae bacterium]
MEFRPSTGKPVETDLVLVTVTHADGPTSDALALACMVLGKKGYVPARTI